MSGSIVHAGTLGGNSWKYTSLIAAGVLLTVFGNYLEYRRDNLKIGAKLLFLTILLSLGTGMLSGGVQHFADNPAYGSLLLSVGVGITFLSLAYKDFAETFSFKFVPATVLVGAMLYLTLPVLSSALGLESANINQQHDDGHAHAD